MKKHVLLTYDPLVVAVRNRRAAEVEGRPYGDVVGAGGGVAQQAKAPPNVA